MVGMRDYFAIGPGSDITFVQPPPRPRPLLRSALEAMHCKHKATVGGTHVVGLLQLTDSNFLALCVCSCCFWPHKGQRRTSVLRYAVRVCVVC